MLAAQPQEELLQQLFIATHGDPGADQRVNRVAIDIDGAGAVDTPAPVQYPGAVLDQIDRGGDVGSDPGIRAAIDNHIEARPDLVQRSQKTTVATVVPGCGEDTGNRGAVPSGLGRIPGVHADAAGITAAVACVVGEIRIVEVHVPFDHADTHRPGVDVL